MLVGEDTDADTAGFRHAKDCCVLVVGVVVLPANVERFEAAVELLLVVK